MAHAYYVAGETEPGIARATSYAVEGLGLSGLNDPDLVVLRYGLFSVEDARKLADIAYAAPTGAKGKAIIVSLTRVFHEAQNALLKLFEEPPQGVTLTLVVPTEGLLLQTLRSRISSLPSVSLQGREAEVPEIARLFIAASDDERSKQATRLLDRTKSDKDEEKQRARNDAVLLLEGMTRAAERAYRAEAGERERHDLRLLLDDLNHFLPLLHTRATPLKLILEHLLIVIPNSLRSSAV